MEETNKTVFANMRALRSDGTGVPGCVADKNECAQFGACSHICNNTKGSYKCICHKHFTKINDTCKADGEGTVTCRLLVRPH